MYLPLANTRPLGTLGTKFGIYTLIPEKLEKYTKNTRKIKSGKFGTSWAHWNLNFWQFCQRTEK